MEQGISEQVERLARKIWSRRFDLLDRETVAHRYGFAKDKITLLNWAALPDAIKAHMREMARREIE